MFGKFINYSQFQFFILSDNFSRKMAFLTNLLLFVLFVLLKDQELCLVDFMAKNQMIEIVESKKTPSPKFEVKHRKGRTARVKEFDRKVLEIVQKKGPITRPRLVTLTGIARSTLYDSLRRLTIKGYVQTISEDRERRGRPKTYFYAVFGPQSY
jgi:ribosomal protein S25